MIEATTLEQELTALDREIQVAITKVSAGDDIDVSHLDEAVRSLCSRSTQISASERETVKLGLATLDESLSKLAEAIQGRLPSSEPSASLRGRAAAAYSDAESDA